MKMRQKMNDFFNDFRARLGALFVIVTAITVIATVDSVHASTTDPGSYPTTYKKVRVDRQDIFYREAGNPEAPTILLLHGFPASSHMFRNLIPKLSDKFHLVAPDYPGFGYSSTPSVKEFDYTFDNLAAVIEKFTNVIGLKTYSLYIQDYGSPIGFRLALKNPEKIQAFIVQNGNAYEEGLLGFWNPIRNYWADPSKENEAKLREFLKFEATKWQFTHGMRDPSHVSPDSYTVEQAFLDRPGNNDIQLKLFLDYRSNPPLYPKWQAYLRERQPPTLVVWGKNDQIFVPAGAEAFKRDLKNIDFHLLDTGHFALEEDVDVIAEHIKNFFDNKKIK